MVTGQGWRRINTAIESVLVPAYEDRGAGHDGDTRPWLVGAGWLAFASAGRVVQDTGLYRQLRHGN